MTSQSRFFRFNRICISNLRSYFFPSAQAAFINLKLLIVLIHLKFAASTSLSLNRSGSFLHVRPQ